MKNKGTFIAAIGAVMAFAAVAQSNKLNPPIPPPPPAQAEAMTAQAPMQPAGASAQQKSPVQQKGEVYMVGQAHLDTQWNWTIQKTIGEYLPNTLYENFWLIEHYPDYIFNFEGADKYAWFKEYYPFEFAKVKELIASGRWHVCGSSWDATDPNMPSPESFFRNILYGQEFYKNEFDVQSTDIYLPDCFGFGWQLPTIAAHCGLTGFSTQKLSWRKQPFYPDGKKYPFDVGVWRGIDGSEIVAALNGGSYVQKYYSDVSSDKELQQLVDETVNHKAFRYYGNGDFGGAASPITVKSIEEGIHNPAAPFKVISATSDQLFKQYLPISAHPELPVWNDELLMDVHATGCYTSQAAMKRYNRRNEQLADAAERASVMAELAGGYDYPLEKLSNAWKRFIWHQFHDDLTGTSIMDAYRFSWNDEILSQSDFANIITAATASVARALDTQVKGNAVVVYNPSAFSRRDLVHAFVPMAPAMAGAAAPSAVSVFSPKGKVNSQLLSCRDGVAEILFTAEVAPVSQTVFDVEAGGNAPSALKASGNTIENSIYKVTLDKNGDIASIWDKRAKRELVEKGKAFRLAVFTNDESQGAPAWEILKKVMDREPVAVDDNVKISTAYLGAASAALKVERNYGGSKFSQLIRLTDGGADDRIDVITDIDWKSLECLLKVEFPMAVANPVAMYDIGVGAVGRDNDTELKYEVYAHQWADITAPDNSYGVAITDDCKYGWDKPNDNTLRLTLLHTPKCDKNKMHSFQGMNDVGHHTLTYSIIGHRGNYVDAGVVRKAEAMNNPLFAFNTSKHTGALGREYGLVASSGVEIRAVKKAEDGSDWYIVRTQELSGKDVKGAQLIFNANITGAVEMNGVEEKIGPANFAGNKLTFDARRFAPATFGVKLAAGGAGVAGGSAKMASGAGGGVKLRKPAQKSVWLPFNILAFTPDGFYDDKVSVDIDGKGDSYSYDLLPKVISSEGVDFRLGAVEYAHALECDGQKIDLGNSTGGGGAGKFKTLYLLAASVDGDRSATFGLGGQQYERLVPFWSGFYAQWGHNGAQTYVRDANVAYIGTHIHNITQRNVPYIYGYMYKIALPLGAGATTLALPKDKKVIIFAATLSEQDGSTTPANEFRAI